MSIETDARTAWKAWGADARYGICLHCKGWKYVRRALGGRRWLCLECWDRTS